MNDQPSLEIRFEKFGKSVIFRAFLWNAGSLCLLKLVGRSL
jgi:hypothetical protein